MYLRLRASGTAHVVLNSWTRVGLSLWDPHLTKIDVFRPYQTVLLTDTDLTEFPAHPSPEIAVFVAHAKPTASFAFE